MQFVYNAREKEKPQESNKLPSDEFDHLIHQVKEAEFNAKTIVFDSEHYLSFMSNERMAKDIERFCVLSNAILSVDTTFELKDGLWLTDSSFPSLPTRH